MTTNELDRYFLLTPRTFKEFSKRPFVNFPNEEPEIGTTISLNQSSMTNHQQTDFGKILAFYNIKATPSRIQILQAIYKSRAEFNIQQIESKLSDEKTPIGINTIKSILRLYHSRGLLTRHGRKGAITKTGRPTIWYSLSGRHILSIL